MQLNAIKYSGSTTDDIVDYMKPITRKKPDVIIMDVGTNDLTKGVNMMSKVRKIISAIQEVDSTIDIQLGFSVFLDGQTKIIVKKLRISILD